MWEHLITIDDPELAWTYVESEMKTWAAPSYYRDEVARDLKFFVDDISRDETKSQQWTMMGLCLRAQAAENKKIRAEREAREVEREVRRRFFLDWFKRGLDELAIRDTVAAPSKRARSSDEDSG